MIKQVEITNSSGEKFILDLVSPEESGLAIGSIDGLGPTKANINVTSSATTDISRYNSAHLDYRNVVFKFVFFPKDKLIENTRLKTYEMFPMKKRVHIAVLTDNRYLCTDGYVESNEPAIFSEREGTSVSIICPDPFFYSESDRDTDVTGTNIKKSFKFPFVNIDKVQTQPVERTIQFGTVGRVPRHEIFNMGDAEIGLKIILSAEGGNVENPYITDLNKNTTMRLITERVPNGFNDGEEIVINTVNGNKKVTLLRKTEYEPEPSVVDYYIDEINIISALESYANWHQLEKGMNVFSFGADSGVDNLKITYEYTIVYEGI